MADIDYVKQYFSDHARQWLAGAYGEGPSSRKYPIGPNRVRVAIEAVVGRLGSTDCALIDLGCGGGDLCLHAARLGMTVTGVDIAPGMIEEAQSKRAALAPDQQQRVTFTVGNVLEDEAGACPYDAVTAMGLIEYLPEDGPFLDTAFRLLRPGGVLALSCRNRLFNMASLNAYTASEVASGSAGELLEEIGSLTAQGVSADTAAAWLGALASAMPDLQQAIANDTRAGQDVPPGLDHRQRFTQQRRQHTPAQLEPRARAAGFTDPAFVGVHAHPLPPAVEKSVPCFYNQVARLCRVFEHTPMGLVWSSAFIAVLSKPE